MTPSMYVVCSEHICQGLRGWAAGVGGRNGGYWEHREDRGEETRRFTEGVSYCVCVCVYAPLLWQGSLIPCVYCGRISLII